MVSPAQGKPAALEEGGPAALEEGGPAALEEGSPAISMAKQRQICASQVEVGKHVGETHASNHTHTSTGWSTQLPTLFLLLSKL